jgi:hypothetical protein
MREAAAWRKVLELRPKPPPPEPVAEVVPIARGSRLPDGEADLRAFKS